MARPQHPQRRRFQKTLGSGAIPPAVVISRMDHLRRTEEHEQATALALEAATGDPSTAVGMLAILHAAGRQADVEMLLRLIASADPVICGDIVHALYASANSADADTLIRLLQKRPTADVAAAAAAFDHSAGERGDSSGNPLLVGLAARPGDDLVTELARLRDENRDADATALLTVIGQGGPLTVCAAAAALADRRLTKDAGTLLIHYAGRAAALDLARLFLQLTETWESAALHVAAVVAGRSDVAAFLAALQTLMPQVPQEDCLGILAERLTSLQRVELCRVLTGRWALEAVDDLIGWCARHGDARSLQAELHHAGMHAAAYHLAEKRAETTGRYEP